MKNLFVILWCALAAILLTTAGCKRSSGPSYYMRAKLNDKDNNVNYCIAFSSSGSTVIDPFQPTATSVTYPYIVLVLQDGLWMPGKSIPLDGSKGCWGRLYTSPNFYMPSTKGTILIDQAGGALSGTFSFTTTDGNSITDGTFSAKRI